MTRGSIPQRRNPKTHSSDGNGLRGLASFSWFGTRVMSSIIRAIIFGHPGSPAAS